MDHMIYQTLHIEFSPSYRPFGKRLHNNWKIHHAINGKTHYVDWAILHSFVNVYQRVTSESKIGFFFVIEKSFHQQKIEDLR